MKLQKSIMLRYAINPSSVLGVASSFSAPFPLFEQAKDYFVRRKVTQDLSGTKMMLIFDEFSTINPSVLSRPK